MSQRRELEIALLAALAVAMPGCAGKSLWPAWSNSSSTANSSAGLSNLTAKNSAANSSPSMLSKASTSLSNALTIKPKVTPAFDATSLSSKTGKLDAELYVSAARMQEGQGNFPAAAEQYKKALEIAPKDVPAMVGLARLHDRQEQFAEAEKLYQKATQVDPNSALAWNDLGLCYARQKRMDESIRTLEVAIRLQPKNAMYRNNVATVLVEAGRADVAWSHLSVVNPPAIAHYNLAYLLHQKKQDAQAAEHLQQALAADPTLAAAEQLLAQVGGGGDNGALADVSVEVPSAGAPSYSLSDLPAAETTVHVANNSAQEWEEPLAPSTRRAPIYRMPPIEEQADDPAPSPKRLPLVEEGEAPVIAKPATGPELNAPAGAVYPVTQTSHVESVSEIRQPKAVIRLLGSEPLTPPVPGE